MVTQWLFYSKQSNGRFNERFEWNSVLPTTFVSFFFFFNEKYIAVFLVQFFLNWILKLFSKMSTLNDRLSCFLFLSRIKLQNLTKCCAFNYYYFCTKFFRDSWFKKPRILMKIREYQHIYLIIYRLVCDWKCFKWNIWSLLLNYFSIYFEYIMWNKL